MGVRRWLLGSDRDPRCTAEGLESRLLLDAVPFAFAQYFPEGFATDSINEYVPMTNTNSTATTYELWAKYELGERDQLIASGTIPANTRGGVTISDVARPNETLVRKGEPYALVLKSSQPLAATLSHYDFGTAVGESFTATTATEWTFGDGRKSATLSRDYILVYNPGPEAVDVTITLYGSNGQTTTDSRRIEPERRSGFSMQDIAALPEGLFAAKITATAPVVASQSHYELGTKRGYGVIGTPGGGALAGVVPSIEFDDSFYESNGDDSGEDPQRYAADAYLSILNTNSAPATVTLTFFIDVPGSGDVQTSRAAVVPANSTIALSIRSLGVSLTSEFGVVYRSNLPVTVTGSVYQGQDGTGVNASTVAATRWEFGEGFMSRTRAGGQIQEELYIFNPGGTSIDVTITFNFTDGTTMVVTGAVGARELEDLKVHRLTELVDRAEDQWYGIRIDSPTPIVASMEHWDGGIGGGFSTLGMPVGTSVSFASVLTL